MFKLAVTACGEQLVLTMLLVTQESETRSAVNKTSVEISLVTDEERFRVLLQ